MTGWNTMLLCILTAIPLSLILYEVIERWDEFSERWQAIAERWREITERW